jgi:hypothetical protein
MGVTITVGNEADLNQAIATVDAAVSGSYTIAFAGTIFEGTDTGAAINGGTVDLTAPPDLYALNLAPGVSVTIKGAGYTLDGANAYRGLFVYAGAVTIEDLTIADAHPATSSGAWPTATPSTSPTCKPTSPMPRWTRTTTCCPSPTAMAAAAR